MNKQEIIEAIASAHPNLSRGEIHRILAILRHTVGNKMKRGRNVQSRERGTFSAGKGKARTGRNSKTGKPIKSAAATLRKFSAAKALKLRISKKK